jgi:hypothetical protein
MNSRKIRIGCGQGFWGDWIEAPVRLVEAGDLDYLMLDYLAEVTMSILAKQFERDPSKGYASDFPPLVSRLKESLVSGKLRIIANAGGVNPEACARAVVSLIGDKIPVAIVKGDSILSNLDNFEASGCEFLHLESGVGIKTVRDNLKSMNAYLGAKSIVEALEAGAKVIITGRVSDPAMCLAPIIHEYKIPWDDYDRLASGVVAGHIIECGAQATGGNYSYDWSGVSNLSNIGYPIVEFSEDGSFVVTKPDTHGGLVTVQSVTEQLVYEIGDPQNFITPDVVADFTTINLKSVGDNKIEVSGVKGTQAPDTLKVSASYFDGYMAEGTLILVGPRVREKASICEKILRDRIFDLKLEYSEILFERLGDCGSTPGISEKLNSPEPMEIVFRVAIRGSNKKDLERFTREVAPLVLSGPSGITGYAGGKKPVREVYSYFPTLISKSLVKESVEIL